MEAGYNSGNFINRSMIGNTTDDGSLAVTHSALNVDVGLRLGGDSDMDPSDPFLFDIIVNLRESTTNQ